MIFILSKYPFLGKGHYWSFDGYLRNVLISKELPFVFINPSAEKAKDEDRQVSEKENRYLVSLEGDEFIIDAIRMILNQCNELQIKSIKLLLPWLPQFSLEELNRLSEIESELKVEYIGLSTLNAELIQGRSNCKFRYTHEEFFESRSKKTLWVSNFLSEEYPEGSFIREIPDFAENFAVKNSSPKFDICFFGLLTPYRGLFEILMISLFNPNLKIRIKGYGFASHRILRPWRFKYLRYQTWRTNPFAAILYSSVSLLINFLKYLPNVDFSSSPFDTEDDLDLAMGDTKVMFYCPKLPHGSGLTNKSLAAGIPVFWNGWEGQAYRLLKRYYPEGYFSFREIFIPGRFSKKIKTLSSVEKTRDSMWNDFSQEVFNILK